MLCPLCRDTQLTPRFSHGIEVDVCPRCRGVWLDRGELERLLTEGEVAPPPVQPAAPPVQPAAPTPHVPARRPEPERRRKSKAKRLADLFEDVLDL